MKFLFSLFSILFVLVISSQAQVSISGNVTDALTGSPLIQAKAEAASHVALTGADGNFNITLAEKGKYTVIITLDGYELYSAEADASKGSVSLGVIKLNPSLSQTESGLSEIMLGGESDDRDQAVSGLLRSSGDVFTNTASYTFSSVFFKMRGYDSEYENAYIEGVPVNDGESGRAVYGEWGGLNDVFRNREYLNGIEPGRFSIGTLGGSTNFTTRASKQRKQTKFSYSLSNRTYTNRLMFTYSTGLMDNNWAFTVSGSRRWANEGYIEGTFYNAYAYFVGAEKKINARHSLALTAFGSPTERGMNSASTQEVYDLTGTNYYNANWGYQNGDKRNARVRNSHEPKIILSHYWTLDEKTTITSSLAYSFGKTGTTSLNWYNANDPRPDYYRNLPNFQQDPTVPIDPFLQSEIIKAWQNDASRSQINWDKLYQVNYLGNLNGEQAHYIIENNITAQNQWFLNSHINKQINDHNTFSGGVELSHYKGAHYKVMDDLLGGEYWVDIDQYSQRDFEMDTLMLQNDLNDPNRVIKEGDKFGYNYALFSNVANLWALEQFSFARIDAYAGAAISASQYWREGYMRNGRNPDNSYGKSSVNSNLNFTLKAGGTYKITGRHYFTLNAAFITRPPLLMNAYISPRNGADLVSGLKDEKIFSGDLSYILRFPNFNGRITVYETYFQDHCEITRFYHDDLQTFVNMALNNQDRVHQGIEFGAEGKLSSTLKAVGVVSFGNYRYTSRPEATINYDNGTAEDVTETIYAKNFYLGGTPQFASSLGLRFNKNYWFIDVNGNYYDKIWLDFNPLRRSQSGIANLGPGDPLIQTIIEQQQLDGGFTLDASIGKSIRLNSYFLNINFSVSNILDNTNLTSGGYEQNRFDYTHEYLTYGIDKFPPKYYYAYGRTYFLNVGFRF